MTLAVLPGSFDPVTYGHLDLIKRASTVFEGLIVGVAVNISKKAMFTIEQRVAFIQETVADYPGVTVEKIDGLLVDFCEQRDITVVVKGVRSITDMVAEVSQASVNRHISGVETILLPTRGELEFISSTLVRELAAWGADLSDFVPPHVARVLSHRETKGTRNA